MSGIIKIDPPCCIGHRPTDIYKRIAFEIILDLNNLLDFAFLIKDIQLYTHKSTDTFQILQLIALTHNINDFFYSLTMEHNIGAVIPNRKYPNFTGKSSKMRFPYPYPYPIANGVSKKVFFLVWHITTEAGEKTSQLQE